METSAAIPRLIWLRVPGFTVLVPGLVLAYAPYLWIISPGRVEAGWPPDITRAPALLAIAVGFALYAMCFAAGFHARVLLFEEPTLRKLFGEEFDSYCARVRRWGVF